MGWAFSDGRGTPVGKYGFIEVVVLELSSEFLLAHVSSGCCLLRGVDQVVESLKTLHRYLAHKKMPPILGASQGPRHRPTGGSYGMAFFFLMS